MLCPKWALKFMWQDLLVYQNRLLLSIFELFEGRFLPSLGSLLFDFPWFYQMISYIHNYFRLMLLCRWRHHSGFMILSLFKCYNGYRNMEVNAISKESCLWIELLWLSNKLLVHLWFPGEYIKSHSFDYKLDDWCCDFLNNGIVWADVPFLSYQNSPI